MFGAIVAGRLVQTNLQQVDDTHFTFPIENPHEVNHMTVFLLGTIPFPEGYGAGVHFAWPGGDYIPLGYLSNDKPSAIFRLRSSSPSSLVPIHNHQAACIGIELIHLSQLRIMIESSEEDKAKGKEVAARTDVGLVAEKVVKNLFNYLHSFGGETKLTPETPIPLSVFEKWYSNFLRKIEMDRGASFLDREE